MKIRNLSMLSVLAAALSFSGAHAAETVIGGGAPQSCYEAAENGWSAKDYIPVCNNALVGILSDRDRAATLVNRGILKLSLLNAQGSLEDFDRGLTINAGMAEGYVNRGASLILMKRYGEAVDTIDKGLAMKAKKPQLAYYDRGLANEAMGNIQAAYADYKQAQLIDPFFELPAVELKRFKVVTKPAGT
jgi:tetratricopeptide (TPR) repeat protein